MMVCYVDTSALASIAFGEPDALQVAERLGEFTRLISSNLLEAELRAAFLREGLPFRDTTIARIEWVLPTRPLAAELADVLGAGYLRGADLWHVAAALYSTPRAEDLFFATLDGRQRAVAETLGIRVALPAML